MSNLQSTRNADAEQKRRWREKVGNREREHALQRQWCKEHKDTVKMYNRKNYSKNAEARRAYAAAYRKRHPEKCKLKPHHYATARAKHEALLVQAAGRPRPELCELCGQPQTQSGRNGKPRKMAFDHDHSTGKFRGWLCGRCNVVLGWIH